LYYDPINGPHEPDGLSWVHVARVLDHETDSSVNPPLTRLTVRLSDGAEAALLVDRPIGGAFRLRLEVPDAQREEAGEPAVVWTYLELAASDGENYYGLGEVFHSVAHRGKTIEMQMAILENESFNNEAHVRIPLLVSSRSWGLFCNSKRPGFFDLAESRPDTVRTVWNDPALELHLLASPEPLGITEQYVSLTARPAIPPRWAFAPIQWRNEVSGQAMVLEDASAIRENDLPTGAIWVDRPYESGFNTMEFDPEKYPDPTAMVETLHAQGFRLAAWTTPYLHETDPHYQEAVDGGWFPSGVFPFQSFGKLLDLTHPDAMAFWQARVSAALGRGIEGWKLDYAEDIQIGLSDTRLNFDFASGEDERTMNREYATYYHRAYAEPTGLPELFTLARAATIGGQRYASVIWPGDLDSDFKDFGEADGEGTVHVGGLPSAVRAGIGLSVSGFPFFASDTGGFRHERPTHEVMVRWTEYAALLPIFQYGGGGRNHNPWDFEPEGESVFTPETLSLFRRYAILHIQLFPYFYTLAREAHERGRPTLRPFGLAYPDDGRHPEDVFLSGPDLLVAPLWKGGESRSVPLPAGDWIDWWTGEAHAGPADLVVQAPLGTLPLFLRSGAIVPMLRPSVRTLSPVEDLSIDSFETDPGRLWGRVVPPPPGGPYTDRTLHDGTGLSISADAEGAVTFIYTPGEEYAGLRIQVYAPTASEVERNGETLEESTSEAGLDSCEACFHREAGEPWIWIALSPALTGSHTFTIQ
ncbi:MAG: glycoside hydrolase family 31 protein, partial [Polyangia bacterium]|nr:glycoside hydrolase family 31 protein [Polyangia bacterium]